MNDEVKSEKTGYEVWRLDDNGNEFLIQTYKTEELAERKIDELAAGGHKQTYWIREVAI